MQKGKGLFVILAILFISILIGYTLIRVNPNYPVPGKIDDIKNNKTADPEGSATQMNWIEYTPPTKNFKVELPSLPQTTKKTFTDPNTKEKRNYEVYVANGKNGTAYLINIITFDNLKTNVQDEDMLTEVAKDMMTNHPDNKLIKTEPGKFLGYPSLKFSLATEKVEIDTLTFVNGKTLYVLTRIAPLENKDKDEFNFFTNSFELTARS